MGSHARLRTCPSVWCSWRSSSRCCRAPRTCSRSCRCSIGRRSGRRPCRPQRACVRRRAFARRSRSVAAGAMLLVERGGRPARVAELSAVLFLLTSAINVITLAVAGIGLWVGLFPGKSEPLLSLVPGAVSAFVFLGVLALPSIGDRFLKAHHTGRIATAVRSTSPSSGARRRFCSQAIGGSSGRSATCGSTSPSGDVLRGRRPGSTDRGDRGRLSDRLSVESAPDPGQHRRSRRKLRRPVRLFGIGATSATSATIVYHGISLWVPAMWGTVAFLRLRGTRGQPLVLREPREHRRG